MFLALHTTITCMFRTGFQCGFPSERIGKTIENRGPGATGPGMKYTICYVYVFYFCCPSLNKNGRFEQQSIQLNSHFKYRILALY
jgi:hypothetical protein